MVLNRCRRKPKVPLTDNPNTSSFGKPLRGIVLLVAEEEHEFKVDLRIEGIPQDAVLEAQDRMTKIQKTWWTSYELDTIPNRSLPIWEEENPPGSAKNRVVHFKNWEILNYISWRDIPNRSISRVLATRTSRIDLLLLWCVCVCLKPSPEQKQRI